MALLTTVARARRNAALAGAETVHLTNLLTSASEMVEDYCNRLFTSTPYATEDQDGSGDNQLWVRNPPITGLTSIYVIDASGDDETILAADFDWDADTGHVRFDPEADSDFTWFPVGIGNIQITYTGGYAAIPDQVQDAVILVAMQLYGAGAVTNPTLKSERLGEYSYTRADMATQDPFTKTVRAMLGAYRIYGGA